MTRLPPRSTLFPYTTLFRSRLLALHDLEGFLGAEEYTGQVGIDDRLPLLVRQLFQGHGGRAGPDRKSTRLNSSHSSISYAVFCLKKKKQKLINLQHTEHTTN